MTKTRAGRLLSSLLDYLNIKELYPPQKDAMEVVEKGDSLLMSVPTAAGKTLVAYAALIRMGMAIIYGS